jgi:hypothetical protein
MVNKFRIMLFCLLESPLRLLALFDDDRLVGQSFIEVGVLLSIINAVR